MTMSSLFQPSPFQPSGGMVGLWEQTRELRMVKKRVKVMPAKLLPHSVTLSLLLRLWPASLLDHKLQAQQHSTPGQSAMVPSLTLLSGQRLLLLQHGQHVMLSLPSLARQMSSQLQELFEKSLGSTGQ